MSTTETARSPNGAGDLPRAEEADSVLVPLNRETAVAVLGALCVSDISAADVSLPVRGRGLTLLEDGLRGSEVDLVSGGDRRRFPVLLEFPAMAVRKAASGECAIGLSQMIRIIFRSGTEADEFRFRPFDELDTEALPHSVQPEKFGLSGEARFTMKEPDDGTSLAVLVDRFTAGVHGILLLAETHAPARAAAVDFLQQEVASGKPGLHACWHAMVNDAADNDVVRIVARAFASGEGSPEIIDRISSQLARADEKAARVWGEIARGVLQNRIQLTGEQLSDEKSILLRAALLALSADTSAALVTFLRSDRPPGERVAVAASFLVGIKTGVLGLPWAQKKKHLARLSGLTTALLVRAIADPESAVKAITIESVERSVAVRCEGELVAEWTSPQRSPDSTATPVPTALSEGVPERLMAEGYALEGPADEPGSYRFALNGRSVTMSAAVDDRDPSCVLMFTLSADSKLRKKSEIAETFSRPGMLWRPGSFEAAQRFLFCDLPHPPLHIDAPVLASKLDAALGALLVPPKQKKPSTSRARRSKPTQLQDATPDLLAPSAGVTDESPQ